MGWIEKWRMPLSLGVVVLGVVAAVSVVSLSRAEAANPEIADGVCGSSEYCAFQYDGYTGRDADFNNCEPDWYCGVANLSRWEYYNSSTIIDNRTSSIWGRGTGYAYSVWAQYSYGGGIQICQYGGGTKWNQATLNALGMNDKISSMWTSPTCG